MGRRGLLPGRTVNSVTISFGLSENFDLTSRNRGWISQDPRKQDNEGLTRRRAGRSRSPDGLPTAR